MNKNTIIECNNEELIEMYQKCFLKILSVKAIEQEWREHCDTLRDIEKEMINRMGK